MSAFMMRSHFAHSVYHLEAAKLGNDVVYSGPPLRAGKELLSSQPLCQRLFVSRSSTSRKFSCFCFCIIFPVPVPNPFLFLSQVPSPSLPVAPARLPQRVQLQSCNGGLSMEQSQTVGCNLAFRLVIHKHIV